VTAMSTDRDLDTSASMHVTHGDTAADHCRAGHTGGVALAGGGVAPPASRNSTRALGSSVSPDGDHGSDHGSGGAGAYEKPPRQGSSQSSPLLNAGWAANHQKA
jgi:hypothetical protein